MPRTCTTDERNIIKGLGVNHLLYLSVADGDGTLQDCSALGALNLDLLDGSSWSESVDAPIMTGTLTICRDTSDDTAAPTMGASSINRTALGDYAPLFEKGRAILMKTATVAQGAEPTEGDKKPMFEGRISAIHWHASPMTIDIADIGAWLVDATIQVAKQYVLPTTGPGDGPLLGIVIRTILDDIVPPAGSITIYEPVTAAFQPVPSQPQGPGSLLPVIRGFAQEIGWELRYRYDASDVFRLTLYEPDRENTTPDWIFGPGEYRNVTNLETSINNIRNYIKGWYTDSTGSLKYVISKDDVSIAKYGGPNGVPRFMQITSTTIRTETDMQALCDAVRSDLSEAAADQEIELPYCWPIQIGDVCKFLANGTHYDTDQTLAVVGYTHSFAKGEGSTTIRARGKVAGAYRIWLTRGGVGGAAPGAEVPPAPTIGPIEVEGTARDGNGEAMMHIPMMFDDNTTQILVYASEGPDGDDPPEAPDLIANKLATTIVRHEGDIASSRTWSTEFSISTTFGFQRRVFILPIGPRLSGNPTVDIELCADAGAPPSAPPSNLVVTMSTVDGVPKASLSWDLGDVTAFSRIWRNGIILVPRYGLTLHALEDTNLSPDVVYSYKVQQIKNGQTTEFAGVADTTSDAPSLADPTWEASYPRNGGYDSTTLIPLGNGIVLIGVINPNDLSYTDIYMNDAETDTGSFIIVATLNPGETRTSLNASLTPNAVTDEVRWFYLVATRPGYADSAPSAHASATFGF